MQTNVSARLQRAFGPLGVTTTGRVFSHNLMLRASKASSLESMRATARRDHSALSICGSVCLHLASLFFLTIGGYPKASESFGRVRNAG